MKQLLFAIALIIGLVFIGTSKVESLPNPPSFDQDESPSFLDQEPAIDTSEDNQDIQVQKEEINMEDIFGSEQVFPFEPGFS